MGLATGDPDRIITEDSTRRAHWLARHLLERSRMKRCALSLALLFAITIVACQPYKVPYGYSYDRHEFLSTPERPVTIVIEQQSDGAELWRLDIPVNQKAVIDLGRDDDGIVTGVESHLPARYVHWGLYEPTAWPNRSLPQKAELPGERIRMRFIIRESAEVQRTEEVPIGPLHEKADPTEPTMPVEPAEPVESSEPVEPAEFMEAQPVEPTEEDLLDELEGSME